MSHLLRVRQGPSVEQGSEQRRQSGLGSAEAAQARQALERLGEEEAAIAQVASALLGPHTSSAGGGGGGGDSSSTPVRVEEQAERAEVERALRLLWRHYGELGEGMRDYLLQSAITG